MKSAAVVAALALALGLAAAGVEDVMILGKSNFEKTIAGDSLVMVKFFAPWCGHCKAMKEDYEQAANEMKGKAILAEVDATQEAEIASKYGISGFPTLKIFRKGDVVAEYNGGRDSKSLVAFMKVSMEPPVTELKDAKAVEVAAATDIAVGFFIGKASGDVFTKFEAAAMQARAQLPSGVRFHNVDSSLTSALPKSVKVKDGEAVLKMQGASGDKALWHTLPVDEHLQTALVMGAMPFFSELSRENAQQYISQPCAVLFVDPKDATDKKYLATMEEGAKRLAGNGKLLFTWVDMQQLSKFKEQIGVTYSNPGLAIIEFEDLVKYVYEPEGDFTADKLVAWVQKYIDGVLLPSLKSQEPPSNDLEGHVKVVVGKTFESVVYDNDKDVLLEQYAPWCGHCKQLEPAWKKVAEVLKDVPNIVIAKMDATENDAPKPWGAKGFPTIQLFPAGNKKGATEFEGKRSVEGIVAFLKENAKHAGKIPNITAEDLAVGKDAPGDDEDVGEGADDAVEEIEDGGELEDEKEEL